MATLQIDIPDETLPLFIDAVTTYNGNFTLTIPAYQAQIRDPNFTDSIDDGQGNMIPNTASPIIDNPVSPDQYATNQLVAFVAGIVYDRAKIRENDIAAQSSEDFKKQAFIDADTRAKASISKIDVAIIAAVADVGGLGVKVP